MGTIWTDMRPMVQHFDRDNFTLYAFDPPGQGKSRPPERVFTENYHHDDAEVVYQFMKAIGLKSTSLMGWSDGGMPAMIMAAKHPEVVEKLIVWGATAYLIPEEIANLEHQKDMNNWSKKLRALLTDIYGAENLQKSWLTLCDALEKIKERGGDICKDVLKDIECPTLVLHGEKDPSIAPEHPKYLVDNIKRARLHLFPDGRHSLHFRYTDEFLQVVYKFLKE